MIGALAFHTLRECQRRPFPYVAGAAIVLLALASQLFSAFTFGAGTLEAANLAISAVFLAGLLHAAFLGTLLIREDLERGTYGLLMSQPVSLPAYLAGRYLGAVSSALLLCLAVAVLVAAILLLPVPGSATGPPIGPMLYEGWLRALFPILILEAAALAASATASRVLAPVLLVALFAGGTLSAGSALGWLLPDLALFALEAGGAPGLAWMMVYTFVYASVFLLFTYLVLSCRIALRGQS